MRAAPTYDFYEVEHRGSLAQDAFEAALPLAVAKVEAMAGPYGLAGPHADRWAHAACAMAELVAGASSGGTLAGETVGSTSLTYSQKAQRSAEEAELAAVTPWLSGTGLLCAAVGAVRRA